MIKLGLLGKDISHSRSQEMYEKLLKTEVDYHLLDIPREEDLPSLRELFVSGFKGLSVTYPYKKSFTREIDKDFVEDLELEAINCIKYENGQIQATNTDYLAAKALIQKENLNDFLFIILGSGNMANIFEKVFQEISTDYLIYCRKTHGDLNSIDYKSLVLKDKKIFIINCCSREFVFRSQLPSGTVFWDMNYSFAKHEYLSKKKGLKYREGDDLLYHQAKFALEFWNINTL